MGNRKNNQLLLFLTQISQQLALHATCLQMRY